MRATTAQIYLSGCGLAAREVVLPEEALTPKQGPGRNNPQLHTARKLAVKGVNAGSGLNTVNSSRNLVMLLE
jgi:hypothetical protein